MNRIISGIATVIFYLMLSYPNHYGKWELKEILLLIIMMFLFNIVLELEDLNNKNKEG